MPDIICQISYAIDTGRKTFFSAKESREPFNYRCDFKFKSYTFNAGRTFPGGFNLRIFTENGAENTVGERLEGYLKIAINRWRADQENNRITKVSEIRKLMKENEDRSDTPWNKLLKCKKTPQV